jgi:DNA-binding response OmpR family regulator
MPQTNVREYILIIEDEPSLARVLLRTLHREGFHAAAAMNVDEAFNALDERTPDLILLDGGLPIISGVEICRILRTKHSTRNTPILFLSGDHSAAQRLAATEAGVDGFLAKPYLESELVGRVRTLLKRRAEPR